MGIPQSAVGRGPSLRSESELAPTTKWNYFADLENSPRLKQSALSGGLAAVASTYGSGALQLTAAIVLARMLTPVDFGLVAIVALLTSCAPQLIDFGVGDATTQNITITPSQVSTLFWLNTGIGLAVAIVVALCSPVIALVYQEPQLESIALGFSITFSLIGLSLQHLALLRRTMQFVVIAKIQVLSALAGLGTAVSLAYLGFGYWALVFRPLASASCMLAGAWLACSWRPSLAFSGDEVKSMVRFGLHVMCYSIVASISRAADRITLGLVHRPQEVGAYHNALVLYENSIFVALAQIHGVASTALGRFQSEPAALRQRYGSALATLAFFVMPASVIISLIGQDAVVTLLGEKWRESGLLLSIVALRGIAQVVQSSQG